MWSTMAGGQVIEVDNFTVFTVQNFKIFFKNQNSIINLPVKWEVCEKSTFLSLRLAKGVVGV
jgi:hypothetical protein